MILIAVIVALIIFAFMKNATAKRNDKRRERLAEKQEELMQMLKEKNKNEE